MVLSEIMVTSGLTSPRSFILTTMFILTAAVPPGLKQCPATNVSRGIANCFANETCCAHQLFGASGCTVMTASGQARCCAPGPALEISKTMPNCLIIGDSVSDQYTPQVAQLLNSTCLVQHAPWCGGGSANDAANGLLNLLDCRWLRTASRPDEHVNWDIIQFNFGLHDLMKTTPELLSLYTSQLENITDILLASGAKHVQYALTTPFQADALPACGPFCDRPSNTAAESEYGDDLSWPQPVNGGNGRCGPPMCEIGSLGCGVPNATAKALGPQPESPGCGPPTFAVAKLNAAAAGIMAKRGVRQLDLNSLVHAHCGANYSTCELCDDETKYTGIRCGFHYSSIGVPILAQAVAESFIQLLS